MTGVVLAWLASDPGLLVVGTSLVLGGLGYIWVDCLRLWRVRRSAWDAIDFAATTIFLAMILGVALALQTYNSLPAAVTGAVAAGFSYLALRRLLRLESVRDLRSKA